MPKTYSVRLSVAERDPPAGVIKKVRGAAQRVRRAPALVRADAGGPGWTDARIAEAVGGRTKAAENPRERFLTGGVGETLAGKARATPPRPEPLDGERDAKVLAPRLGTPLAGFAHRTLGRRATTVVEWELAEAIRHEAVRPALKNAG